MYNIGTDSERTVLQVAQDIAKRFNMDTGRIVNVRDRAFNDRCALPLCVCETGLEEYHIFLVFQLFQLQKQAFCFEGPAS